MFLMWFSKHEKQKEIAVDQPILIVTTSNKNKMKMSWTKLVFKDKAQETVRDIVIYLKIF